MRAVSFKKQIPFRDNLIVQENFGRTNYRQLHTHNEIQITYIVRGKGNLYLGENAYSYKVGDIFVIGNDSPHLFSEYCSDNKDHRISIYFTKNSFGSGFFEICQMEQINRFFNLLEAGVKIRSNFQCRISKKISKLKTANKFDRFMIFMRLIKTICDSDKIWLSSSFSLQLQSPFYHEKRMRSVYNYVMNNLGQNITLGEVAELACMTPNAFCTYFKKRTNQTFFSFLTEARIEYACLLLKSKSEYSIAQVSIESGFQSISHFNRKFKRHKGMTPSVYLRAS